MPWLPPASMMAMSYTLKQLIVSITTTKKVVDRSCGQVIYLNFCQVVAPSRLPASYNSDEIPCSPAR